MKSNRNGIHETWYDNGQMWERNTYKDGKLDGLCEKWSNSGQLRLRENYKNGELNGLFEFWHEDGKLSWRSIYENGKKIKSLPTDVTLQELANMGELDEKYLYN